MNLMRFTGLVALRRQRVGAQAGRTRYIRHKMRDQEPEQYQGHDDRYQYVSFNLKSLAAVDTITASEKGDRVHGDPVSLLSPIL